MYCRQFMILADSQVERPPARGDVEVLVQEGHGHGKELIDLLENSVSSSEESAMVGVKVYTKVSK